MRLLLTAPYVGEIGWELLSWQGRVRRVFRDGRFDRLVVMGGAGKAAFYADMPLDYRTVDLSQLPGEACEDRRITTQPRAPVPAGVILDALVHLVKSAREELIVSGAQVELLWPSYTGQIWPCDERHQAFIRFERRVRAPQPAPWVALVQRTRRFRAQDNWSGDEWNELQDRLVQRGVRVSVYPHEAEGAIELLSGCDLAVGQSTGGLHLAALCGCPAVVWAQPDSYRASPWEMTDRQRYQTLWNPLGTPVHVCGMSVQPSPAQVADWVLPALETIGRRTGTRWCRLGFRSRWHTRCLIDRAVVRRPFFQRWPWPVQQFVRYGLV